MPLSKRKAATKKAAIAQAAKKSSIGALTSFSFLFLVLNRSSPREVKCVLARDAVFGASLA